jgi:hypothetical protein
LRHRLASLTIPIRTIRRDGVRQCRGRSWSKIIMSRTVENPLTLAPRSDEAISRLLPGLVSPHSTKDVTVSVNRWKVHASDRAPIGPLSVLRGTRRRERDLRIAPAHLFAYQDSRLCLASRRLGDPTPPQPSHPWGFSQTAEPKKSLPLSPPWP